MLSSISIISHPPVSSNADGWKIPELSGGLFGKASDQYIRGIVKCHGCLLTRHYLGWQSGLYYWLFKYERIWKVIFNSHHLPSMDRWIYYQQDGSGRWVMFTWSSHRFPQADHCKTDSHNDGRRPKIQLPTLTFIKNHQHPEYVCRSA